MALWKLGFCCALTLSTTIPAASAQLLDPQQVQMINDTASSICTTVKGAKGQKTDAQIQGDVKAQLNGLVGRVVDLGGSGKGSLTREEFEGLTRDATAAALQGDRECRERVFNKMFDKLSAAPASGKQSDRSAAVPYQRRIAIGGFAIGDSFERLKSSVPFGAVSKTQNGKQQVSFTEKLNIPRGMDGAPADTSILLTGIIEEDGGLIARIAGTFSVAGYCRNNFVIDNAMREATRDLGEPTSGGMDQHPKSSLGAQGDFTWYEFKRDGEFVRLMWWETDVPGLSSVTCVLVRQAERQR